MKKEKLTEKIKLEYDLYSTNYVYRMDVIYDLLGNSIKTSNNDVLYLCHEKNKDKRLRFLSRFFGNDREEYGLFKPEHYTRDLKLLDLQCRMVSEHKRRMNDLFEVLTEDNMQEVYRLGMFMVEKHYENSVYMTGSRKILEYDNVHYATMTLVLPMDEAGVQDFFDEELQKIKKSNNREYCKK